MAKNSSTAGSLERAEAPAESMLHLASLDHPARMMDTIRARCGGAADEQP